MLNKLTMENILDNDRYNRTELMVFDYDWMNYILNAYLDTNNNGKMFIKFEYSGFITSYMTVKIDDKEYKYSYDTEKFKEYITNYMKKHIESWNDTYAFDGTQEVIDFYNDIIENGKLQ